MQEGVSGQPGLRVLLCPGLPWSLSPASFVSSGRCWLQDSTMQWRYRSEERGSHFCRALNPNHPAFLTQQSELGAAACQHRQLTVLPLSAVGRLLKAARPAPGMQVCLRKLDECMGWGCLCSCPGFGEQWVHGPCVHSCRAARCLAVRVPCLQAARLLPGPAGFSLRVERRVQASNAQGEHTLPLCTVRSDFPAASPSHCAQIHP